MTRRFSPESERTLRQAGWYPGRTIDTAKWRVPLEESGFVFPEAAERFLGEFGGLSVEDQGSGITTAREAFEFDPLLAFGEDDRFGALGALIGRVIAPLGELANDGFFLGVDEEGVIYLVAGWLARFGSGDAGLENLILGVMPEALHNTWPGKPEARRG
ncbi:SUKH-3 domain-containing protein [Lentzea sp. NPDC051838]|uniref:SUKH-3 domain-containing protein n=1 Tax=Lentzea sp. NPDC051838 TaxID=3154849 RepID=UPI003414EE82